MSGAIDSLNPARPKRVAIVASNPSTSSQTGWPIGFWWAELTHPYWEFTERGYQVDIFSPDGGPLRTDAWSDPRDATRHPEDDLISLGFISSPRHASLAENSRPLSDVNVTEYDAVLLVGGQGPMYTSIDDSRVHRLVRDFYESSKLTAVICHAACVLLNVRCSDGRLLVDGKTWTGFANSQEDCVDAFAVRDGNLITGQQQYSGVAAARLIVEGLGR
jgi:putative intracellular protease/amidase